MNDILEDKEELFDVYKDHFSWHPCKEEVLRKEFNRVINLKIEDMPHWFVLYLIENNYDLNNEFDELDDTF